MKLARIILWVLVGVAIGVGAAVGYQHWHRGRVIEALPSLADRSQPPQIDELSWVILSRREGSLHMDFRDGMGTPRKDIETLLAMDRQFSNEPPIVSISFEPGVTMEDLEATIAQLSSLGVKRFFIGGFFYGKSVLQ